MTKKPRSDKGKTHFRPGGQRSVRIREVRRNPIDLEKLAAALLMLARKNLADESYMTDPTNDDA